MTKRHAQLSWQLMEAKICYYGYFYVGQQSLLTDSQYDELSMEYLGLCRDLGRPNTVIHKSHPGFDDIELAEIKPDPNKPSIRLILRKLAQKC